MPRVNLAEVAKSNEDSLRERFHALLAAWESEAQQEILLRFHDHCFPRWQVSMNYDWDKMEYFLLHGQPYNTYRFHRGVGEPVDLPSENCLQGESPINWDYFSSKVPVNWAVRRRKFNEYAHLEEDFTYGAYYLEGPALESYGKQMIVLKREFLENSANASYLKEDSLQHYVSQETDSDGAIVLQEDLRSDLATFGSVTSLLCLKMEDDLKRLGQDGCLAEVTKTTYIEAQMPDPIGFDAVEKVRIRKLNALEKRYLAQLLLSRDLSKPEESDAVELKNAYYYLIFSDEFPKMGVLVEEF